MIRLCLAILLAGTAVFGQAGEIAPDQWSIQPLLAGAKAPAFQATGADGSTFTFDPDQLERPALIIFYRGGWCPYCNLHWAELRKIEQDLLALDMDMIFMSADKPSVLADAIQDGEELPYYLLSDSSTAVAQAFGIAFRVDDKTYQRYIQLDIVDLEETSGEAHHALPAPATFIVGRDGTLKFQYVNPDFRVRLSPEVLLAAARTMPERRIRKP